MSVQNLSSAEILAGLQKNNALSRCYLTNAQKMLYELPVLGLDAAALQLALAAPGGRVAQVCTRTDWELTFRDRNGVYRAEIKRLEAKDDHLLLTLGERVSFLARRTNIRFCVGARNPVRVSMTHRGETCVGYLGDLSTDGMGVVVDEHHDFKKGDVVADVSFDLRGCPVALTALHITHVALTEDNHPRIGFCFRELVEEEAARVRHAFNEWYLSQRPSFSTRLDA